jgi:hypothetical protein
MKRQRPGLLARAFQTSRQRPTLPHSFPCSTIGSEGLNGRVRNGNGWNPLDMATGNSISFPYRTELTRNRAFSPSRRPPVALKINAKTTTKINNPTQHLSCIEPRLKNFMAKPHGRLVPVSSAPVQRFHTRPINVVISNGPSGGLRPGEISSWGRLHAYMPSAFIQTELRYPACAAGATTGAQEVRPTRSSRTRVGAPQISCAHTR